MAQVETMTATSTRRMEGGDQTAKIVETTSVDETGAVPRAYTESCAEGFGCSGTILIGDRIYTNPGDGSWLVSDNNPDNPWRSLLDTYRSLADDIASVSDARAATLPDGTEVMTYTITVGNPSKPTFLAGEFTLRLGVDADYLIRELTYVSQDGQNRVDQRDVAEYGASVEPIEAPKT